MARDLREEYNEVLYAGRPIDAAFVPSIEAIARLHGMRPASSRKCRVLELACGEGINLASMAQMFPESEFVGIDLADRTIDVGRQHIAALGLTNLRLEADDIMQMGEEWGQFDYILAHGFFSWVPAPVRQQILVLTRKLLAPQGVAFISYNTLPGGRMRQMVRDILFYHVRHITDPQEKLAAARQFAQFVLEGTANNEKRITLHREMQEILTRSDSGLYHDELSEYNEQFLFRDFMDQAHSHQLQFLAEADFASSSLQAIPPSDNVLEREQYIDLCIARRFRQTLLVHEDVVLERDRFSDQMEGLYAAGHLFAPPDADVYSHETVEFRRREEGGVTTNHPVMKIVLNRLAMAWPQAIAVSELRETVEALPDKYDLTAAAFLTQLYRAGVVELYSEPFPLVTTPGEHPRSSRLTRLQIGKRPMVPNLYHRSILLEDDQSTRFVAALDGTRDRASLVAEFGGTPEELEQRLRQIARLGLLEA